MLDFLRRRTRAAKLLELHALIAARDVDAVAAALEATPALLTPAVLQLAVSCGDVDIVRLLLRRGAAPDGLDESGNTAMSVAAIDGNVQIARALLEAGAAIDGAPPGDPLFSAAYAGQLPMLRFLIERGAVLHHLLGVPPRSASDAAALQGHTEAAAFLRFAGVAPILSGTTSPGGVVHHIRQHWGDPARIALAPDLGRGITLHVATQRNETVLITEGLSAVEMPAPPGQESYRRGELVLRLPVDWPLDEVAQRDEAHSWPLDWIYRLVNTVIEGQWLGGTEPLVMASADPPQPLGPGTAMTCWFIFVDGSEASRQRRTDGELVRYYTMLPIYTAERDLERDQGVEALVRRWERAGVDMVARPRRPSVA